MSTVERGSYHISPADVDFDGKLDIERSNVTSMAKQCIGGTWAHVTVALIPILIWLPYPVFQLPTLQVGN